MELWFARVMIEKSEYDAIASQHLIGGRITGCDPKVRSIDGC